MSRPAKKRGGGWSTEGSAKRQQLEERAEKAEERAKKAEEDAKQANDKCDRVICEGEDMKNRIKALEQLVRQFLPSQPAS